MRKSVLGALALVVAGLGSSAVMAASYKYHDVPLTVVSVDAKAKTLTGKTDDDKESTSKVEGAAALKKLASLKAGDKVTVTCKDNEKGDHLAVTAIK